MKYKSDKLKKLETNRFSVFTSNLDKCYFCSNKKDDLHELLPGRNRLNSIKYGYVLPVCRKHHNLIQYDNEWKKRCQTHFEKTHTREEWIKIFYKNYL